MRPIRTRTARGPGANGAHGTRQRDPYGDPLRVRPQAGLLVLFPSWLYHWVHPYVGETPRIAVSFNATVAARSADQRSTEEDVAANPIKIHSAQHISRNGTGLTEALEDLKKPC